MSFVNFYAENEQNVPRPKNKRISQGVKKFLFMIVWAICIGTANWKKNNRPHALSLSGTEFNLEPIAYKYM